jgi:hypothetical protein
VSRRLVEVPAALQARDLVGGSQVSLPDLALIAAFRAA